MPRRVMHLPTSLLLALSCLPAAYCLVTLQNAKLAWVIDDRNCSSRVVTDSLNFTLDGAWSVELSQTQAQHEAGVVTLLQPRVTCSFHDTTSNSSWAVVRWACPWLTPEREEPVDMYLLHP